MEKNLVFFKKIRKGGVIVAAAVATITVVFAIVMIAGVEAESCDSTHDSGGNATFTVIDCLTPEYGVNVVSLGEPFMATEGGVVTPTEEINRTESGVTYLCSDGSTLFIEGTAVTISQ
jgi:hypothetical protein